MCPTPMPADHPRSAPGQVQRRVANPGPRSATGVRGALVVFQGEKTTVKRDEYQSVKQLSYLLFTEPATKESTRYHS